MVRNLEENQLEAPQNELGLVNNTSSSRRALHPLTTNGMVEFAKTNARGKNGSHFAEVIDPCAEKGGGDGE